MAMEENDQHLHISAINRQKQVNNNPLIAYALILLSIQREW